MQTIIIEGKFNKKKLNIEQLQTLYSIIQEKVLKSEILAFYPLLAADGLEQCIFILQSIRYIITKNKPKKTKINRILINHLLSITDKNDDVYHFLFFLSI